MTKQEDTKPVKMQMTIICLKMSHIQDGVTVSEVIQMCVSPSHSFLSTICYTPFSGR